MAGARGRRPGASETREAIVAAARQQFGELGYARTTMRGIARQAGVDTRLVSHYFGSKQQLFIDVVELPFDPSQVIAYILGGEVDEIGQRLASFVLSVLDDGDARATMTGLLRAASSEEEAARLVRDLLTTRILIPLARAIGRDQPELRAALLGSQMAGLIVARHIVGLEPLAATPAAQLATAVAPAMQYYLTGELGAGVETVAGR